MIPISTQFQKFLLRLMYDSTDPYQTGYVTLCTSKQTHFSATEVGLQRLSLLIYAELRCFARTRHKAEGLDLSSEELRNIRFLEC